MNLYFTNLSFILLSSFSFIIISSMKYEKSCFQRHQIIYDNVMEKDGDFKIVLRDMKGRMVDRFEPGKNYKVILTNAMYGMNFRAFSIFTAFDMDNSMKMEDDYMISGEGLGNFVISKKYGVVDTVCPNHIQSGYNRFLTMVESIWQAPYNPVKCIIFKAQVVKADSMIYEDAGNLKKMFCPTMMSKMVKEDKINSMTYSSDMMPPMIKECCACGVASYKVTFQGLWSKKTHPKDWPKQKGMLHWTNLIGATHTENFFIYYNGGQASQAVQSICAYGDNTVLKQQFAEENVKPQLKSYFNTSGMWNEDELEESRMGLISVNRSHHLFSFLTMMGPSPDWCTGVAALDLCMEDCTWKKNFSVELYPFDAGIKHGFTYLPENSDRLDIPNPIRIIDSRDYPFTPHKPVAKIMFERIKPKYNWECTGMSAKGVIEFDDMNNNKNKISQFESNSIVKKRGSANKKNPLDDPTLANMATFLCITSQWTDWSRCSVTCGIGSEMRSRDLIKNGKNELCRHLPLHESRTCEGRKRACDFSARCSLLSWSRWSPCNATCEHMGFQQRSRMFARVEEKNDCLKEMNNTRINEYKSCKKDPAFCDPIVICSEGMVAGSACGKTKTRYYYDASKHICSSFMYRGCKGSLNNFKTKDMCEKTCLDAVKALPQWRKDKMAHLQYQSQSKSEDHKKMPAMASQCTLEVKHGAFSCNGTTSFQIKYYYDYKNGRCRQFRFTGCQGNSNNFPSYRGCLKACMPDQMDFMKTAPVIACKVSEWSHFGPCSTMCGVGEKTRWRTIIRPALNGGTACPDLYSSENCIGTKC